VIKAVEAGGREKLFQKKQGILRLENTDFLNNIVILHCIQGDSLSVKTEENFFIFFI
jgi:hypothetical protein